MYRLMVFLVFISSFYLPQTAFGRDSHIELSISEAMSTDEAKSKLQGVDFYFGNQAHGKIEKSMGEFSTNKKTNAFNKSDEEACRWVMLTALVTLKERALKEGGNAVINVKSNYKNEEFVSDTQYRCGAGNILAGVALKGTIVKIAK